MEEDDTNINGNLLFAIPKKGRLYERVCKLLEGAGIDYYRPHRVDIATCSSLPITLVFLPASDIAAYVGEGKVDLGITGQDIIAETGVSVTELQKLGFGKCKLAVQTPIADHIQDPKSLAGKRIVTSFPNITKRYFASFEDKQKTNIRYVGGSVEAACGLGLADGIVDLVETGTTMKAAGLENIATIMETEAVLISNPNTTHQQLVDKIHRRIFGYLTATRYKIISYNISRIQLPQAVKLTPGRKAPTITPLENDTFVAVSAMIEKSQVSNKMDSLADIGATDILIMHIENCRA